MTMIILIASTIPMVGFAAAAAHLSPSRSDREPLLERQRAHGAPHPQG